MPIANTVLRQGFLGRLTSRHFLRGSKAFRQQDATNCRRLRSFSSSKASASDSSRLDPPDVRKLAQLAQINVTDEEVADWEPKIRDIIKWFDQLQKIDVEGVEPCTRSSLANLLAAREDVPDEFQDREALLDSVPDREGPYVKVPKIL